ncbi:MAG: EamA family transporter [Gemmatimonadaceae bacterium]|nr:EamA family transporter [Gemmatimonadaceae bacterium]
MIGDLVGGHPRAVRLRIVMAFAAVYVLWGSTFLAMRFAVETIPPFLMAGMRHLVAGTLLLAWSWRRAERRPTRADWFGAAVVGVLLLGANGGVAWAEQRIASGTAALIVATVPLWMVLIDWGRPRGIHPGKGVLIGLALGLVGVMLLVGPGELTGHGTVDAVGSLVLVLGSVSWAAGSIVAAQSPRPIVPILATAMQLVTGGVALLLVSAIAGEPAHFSLAHVSAKSALGWGYLVIFGSVVGFTAYVYLLQTTTAARVSTYAYVNPVIAVLLGWAFANEAVTARTLLAAAVIVAGVAIITIARASSAPPPVAEEAIGD